MKSLEYVAVEVCKQTGSELKHHKLSSTDLDKIQQEFDDVDFEGYGSYDFENDEILKLVDLLDLQILSDICAVRISAWSLVDDLSYRVHTNRELKMLLDGTKPLAVFSRPIDGDYDVFGGQKFQEFQDKFYYEEYENDEILYIFISHSDEIWRIKAFKLIIKTRAELGNSPQLEWMEGLLYGYTESQNREYLQKIFKKIS